MYIENEQAKTITVHHCVNRSRERAFLVRSLSVGFDFPEEKIQLPINGSAIPFFFL